MNTKEKREIIKERINQEINEQSEVLVKKIQEVVRIPSVIGNENAMQEEMSRIYEEIGLEVIEVHPEYDKVKTHPGFSDSGIPFEERKNIIGRLKGDSNYKSLTLNGHVDVVSPEPIESWTKDPWGGEIEGNRLYGRGSGDMKAGLIANWFALKILLDLKIRPKGTVLLQSVIEEEAGGAGGTLTCMEEGYTTDAFLASEPHNLNLTIAHAGILYFRVKVFGKTAHAGLAHEGVNAIEKMYLIFNALNKLGIKRGEEVYFELFSKGSGQSVHLNLGTLKGGDWVSNVPGEAVLEARIGFIPSETRKGIKELVNKTIEKAIENDEWLQENPPTIEWFGWTAEPWSEDESSEYIKSLKKTATSILGRDINVIGRASGNDARFTQYYNNSGACFGPVSVNMHGPDEHVMVDSVITTAKVLANHVIDWCDYTEGDCEE